MEYISVSFKSPFEPFNNMVGYLPAEKFGELTMMNSGLGRRVYLAANCPIIFEENYNKIYKFEMPMTPHEVFKTLFVGAGYTYSYWEDPDNHSMVLGFTSERLENHVNTQIFSGNTGVLSVFCPFILNVTENRVINNRIVPNLNLRHFFEELFSVESSFHNNALGVARI